MSKRTYQRSKILLCAYVLCHIILVEAFHEGNLDDQAKFVSSNEEPHHEEEMRNMGSKDYHISHNTEIIVEMNEQVNFETTEVFSAPYGEIQANQYSSSSTENDLNVKQNNNSLPILASTSTEKPIKLATTKGLKPYPKVTEKKLSQLSKPTAASTEKSVTSSTTSSNDFDSSTLPPTSSTNSTTTPFPTASSNTTTSTNSTTEKPETTTNTSSTSASTPTSLTEKPKTPPNSVYCLCDEHVILLLMDDAIKMNDKYIFL